MALRATYGASPRALRGALADGGLPWESRDGGGAPAFTPANYPGLGTLAWWSPLAGISGAPVDSWTDRIAGYQFTATTTKRPAWSATAIVDELGGTHAGLTFNGSTTGMVCADAGFKAAQHAVTGMHILANAQGVTGTLQVLLELGAQYFAQAGAYFFGFNNAVAGSLYAASSGAAAGIGDWISNVGTCSLVDPGVIQVSFGSAGGSANVGSNAQLLDGFQLLGASGGNTSWSSVVYSGSLNTYLGARNQASNFLSGVVGDLLFLPPTATAAQLQWARAFMAAQIGAVQG